MVSRARERRGRRGNCYVTCEALYHLLGGKDAGWQARTVRHEGDVHWYLRLDFEADTPDGTYTACSFVILDPTASQFRTPPPYHLSRARGFLTKRPSKRARALMEKMLWQADTTTPSDARGAGARTRRAASASRTSATKRRKK